MTKKRNVLEAKKKKLGPMAEYMPGLAEEVRIMGAHVLYLN